VLEALCLAMGPTYGPMNTMYSRLVPSETQCLLENISLGRTDHTVRARTVLSLIDAAFNVRYAVEYHVFAII
jgi:hypothetical protein